MKGLIDNFSFPYVFQATFPAAWSISQGICNPRNIIPCSEHLGSGYFLPGYPNGSQAASRSRHYPRNGARCDLKKHPVSQNASSVSQARKKGRPSGQQTTSPLPNADAADHCSGRGPSDLVRPDFNKSLPGVKRNTRRMSLHIEWDGADQWRKYQGYSM